MSTSYTSGTELPKTHSCDRNVIRKRATENQQVCCFLPHFFGCRSLKRRNLLNAPSSFKLSTNQTLVLSGHPSDISCLASISFFFLVKETNDLCIAEWDVPILLPGETICFFSKTKWSCVCVQIRCRAIGAEDFIIKPLQTNDVLRLRSYARTGLLLPPPSLSSKAGTKRKMTSELRHPCVFAGSSPALCSHFWST